CFRSECCNISSWYAPSTTSVDWQGESNPACTALSSKLFPLNRNCCLGWPSLEELPAANMSRAVFLSALIKINQPGCFSRHHLHEWGRFCRGERFPVFSVKQP